MTNRNRLMVLSVIVVVAMCFCLVPLSQNSAQASANNYYNSITATGGKALLGQLHDLITETHTHYTTYDDCKKPSTIVKTDAGSRSGYVKEFYTQQDIDSSWGGGKSGTWNREHVWCQSNSNGMWGTSGGGSDLHHIRPAESNLNSARGNLRFGEAPNGKERYATGIPDVVGGYTASGVFEPIDSVKGDVARIVMYVYTHYNTYNNVGGTTNGKGGSFGTLRFTNIVNASSESAAIALMLDWNKLDPVDSGERNRNDAVYEIQGNRNPFIDNSDFANYIWGGEVVDVPLQSLSMSEDTLTLTSGQTHQLQAIPHPSAAQFNATWTSSNDSVATVSSNGLVTAVGEGTANIVAMSGSVMAACVVTVSGGKVNDSITISESYGTLLVGGTKTLNYSATGAVQWQTSNSAVATVSNGVVTAVGVGEAVITGVCGDASAKFSVTVVEAFDPSAFVSAVDNARNAKTMQDKFNAIKLAHSIYNNMSDTDKQDADVKAAYSVLTDAENSYNVDAKTHNDAMTSAVNTALTSVGGFMLVLAATLAVLKSKWGI